MFFENDSMIFNLLDVRRLNQKNVNMFNSGRNFSALSFRFHADTLLSTETNTCHVQDHSVTFVPARLDYSRKATVDELIVIHFDTTSYYTKEIEHFTPKDPEVLTTLFGQILDCWSKKEIGYKYRCSALLCEIFAECHTQNFIASSKKSKIQKSVAYILKNYKNHDLSMDQIARQSFISEVYFRKLFKKEYGISPQKYIIQLRIQNAIGLISTGYYSLKEVAYMSGYRDYKYFSMEFKRVNGISPSKYLYNF